MLLRSALFCVVLTMSYMVLNFAVYWLPTVILNEGYSFGDAGLIGSTRQLLTVALGFAVGFSMDRFGAGRVLVLCHAVAMALFLVITGLSRVRCAVAGRAAAWACPCSARGFPGCSR